MTTTPVFAQLAASAKPNPSLSWGNTTLHALSHGPCFRCGSCTYPFYSSTAFESPANNREWCSVCCLQDRSYGDEMEEQGAMTSADEVMEHQLQTGNEEVMTKAQLMRMKKEVAFKPFYNESQQRVQQAGFEPSYRLNAPIIDLTADDGGGKPKVASKILPAKSRLGVEKNGPAVSQQAPQPPTLPHQAPKINNGLIATTPSKPPVKRQRKPTQKALPSQCAASQQSLKSLSSAPMRPGGPCHLCKAVKSTSWRGLSVCSKTREGEPDGQRVSVMWCEGCWMRDQADRKAEGKGANKEGDAHDPPKRKEGSSPAKRMEGLREMGEY